MASRLALCPIARIVFKDSQDRIGHTENLKPSLTVLPKAYVLQLLCRMRWGIVGTCKTFQAREEGRGKITPTKARDKSKKAIPKRGGHTLVYHSEATKYAIRDSEKSAANSLLLLQFRRLCLPATQHSRQQSPRTRQISCLYPFNAHATDSDRRGLLLGM